MCNFTLNRYKHPTFANTWQLEIAYYTDKTHRPGFQTLDFLLVHGGGLCLCSRVRPTALWASYGRRAGGSIPFARIYKISLVSMSERSQLVIKSLQKLSRLSMSDRQGF